MTSTPASCQPAGVHLAGFLSLFRDRVGIDSRTYYDEGTAERPPDGFVQALVEAQRSPGYREKAYWTTRSS
jgi:hypothetical protein